MCLPQEVYWRRSNRYSSITAALALRPPSTLHRTTRPIPVTSTSVGAPNTAAGIWMEKSNDDPIAISDSKLNKTPPAEMFCVSAWCSSPELVMAMGSLSGNRTAVRNSVDVSSFVTEC
jgi:hypothetical protein